MKWLVLCLVALLGLSIIGNVILWDRIHQADKVEPQHTLSNATTLPSESKNNRNSRLREQQSAPDISGENLAERPSAPSSSPKQRTIFRIKQQIAAGQYALARQAIQDQLRAQPQDIEYLLLEGELVRNTANVDEVLAHFYSLLDLPLNTEQRASVLLLITGLTNSNIDKLKGIRAWDVLATFLEPLWQFDPNRKSVILALAEAYARQRQEFLMENVLASLAQGDIEATRIRQILTNQVTTEQKAVSADQPTDQSQYERRVSLTSLGDHFIAPLRLGGKQLQLMIDTGASTTVLTRQTFQSLARRHQRQYIGSYKVNTAGGQVTAPIFQIKQIFLGGFRVDDIAVVVLDMPDFDVADGLLGMNLLRQFDFKIDQQSAELLLSRAGN